MEFVMVPVPQEMADAVSQFVFGLSLKKAAPRFDDEAVAGVVRSLDELCQKLLSTVADVTIRGADITVSEVASLLRCDEREALGMMFEVNASMSAGASVQYAITCRGPAGIPSEPRGIEKHMMSTTIKLARAVGAVAERAD